MHRTCVPAEAQPLIHSSGCYPLVNFSRPFCQNHGITLPNYVYSTPSIQIERNDVGNAVYDGYLDAYLAKIAYHLKTDVPSLNKCMKNFWVILPCHMSFPSCDRTQSVLKKKMVCRESCLDLTHSCGRLWPFLKIWVQIRYPNSTELYKLVHCEFPYRNAGDSPECWYFNRHANITGNII